MPGPSRRGSAAAARRCRALAPRCHRTSPPPAASGHLMPRHAGWRPARRRPGLPEIVHLPVRDRSVIGADIVALHDIQPRSAHFGRMPQLTLLVNHNRRRISVPATTGRSRGRQGVRSGAQGAVGEHLSKIMLALITGVSVIVFVLAMTRQGHVIDAATQQFMLFYAGVFAL